MPLRCWGDTSLIFLAIPHPSLKVQIQNKQLLHFTRFAD